METRMQVKRVLSSRIDSRKLLPGDHVYAYRSMHTYSHHGIYVETDRVIHFTRTEVQTVSKLSTFVAKWKSPCKNCGYQQTRLKGVVITCLDCFLKGHELHRFDYNVAPVHFMLKRSGTCSTASCSPPHVVLERACNMLKSNGFGEYNLSCNNCESFAIYCKTGVRTSQQVFSAVNVATCPVSFIFRGCRRFAYDKMVIGQGNQGMEEDEDEEN